MSKKYANPMDFIFPLNINGLEGRFLYIAAQSRNIKSNILLIYDLNSNLEKWWGLAVALSKYSNVTIVDLPGLGGMDSLYKIGRKPSIDNLANYLGTFIKLRYKRKKLIIMAIGVGVPIVTRLLQIDKSFQNKITNLISLNGYAHHDDFNLSSDQKFVQRMLYGVLSLRFISFVFCKICFNKTVLSYRINEQSVRKIKSNLDDQFVKNFMIDLMHENDTRTRFYLKKKILLLDNCNIRLNTPFYHVSNGFKQNNLIQNHLEQHFKIIFRNYNYLPVKDLRTVPFIVNDPKIAIKLIPPKLRRIIKRG